MFKMDCFLLSYASWKRWKMDWKMKFVSFKMFMDESFKVFLCENFRYFNGIEVDFDRNIEQYGTQRWLCFDIKFFRCMWTNLKISKASSCSAILWYWYLKSSKIKNIAKHFQWFFLNSLLIFQKFLLFIVKNNWNLQPHTIQNFSYSQKKTFPYRNTP